MGSFDGAEICELIGLFLLHKLSRNGVKDVGLYRDDGAGALKLTPRQMEQTKKTICRVFEEHGLKITIEANKKTIDFLDVTFDLTLGTYKPYSKPNTKHLYIHTKSNHPPGILKNLAKGINTRLSTISCNEEVFNQAAPAYQQALKESGHDFKLKFDPETKTQTGDKKKKNRKRHCIYFNPPWSNNVTTNVGRDFLVAVDECFPKDGPLGKIFNRNTLKISYRTTPNLKQIISKHNKKVLSKLSKTEQPRLCSCPKKATCPLGGHCLEENVIYQATVIETNKQNEQTTETYVGLTAPNFKSRLGNHTKSFKNKEYSTETTLSSHIWDIKERDSTYTISWKLLDRGRPYNPGTKTCNLCTTEKFYIILKPHLATINKRNELGSACRHKTSSLISKQSRKSSSRPAG